MKVDEALNLLRQVCNGVPGVIESGFKGTNQEHGLLQQALKTVEDKCKEKAPKEK